MSSSAVCISLPYEILCDIFSHLKHLPDVLQCQLACKKWSRPAQERFFKDDKLSKGAKMDSFIQAIIESSHQPGNSAKSLELGIVFDRESSEWDDKNYLANLIEYCPHVETLFTRQVFVEMWKKIVKARQHGQWWQLQKIPSPLRATHLEPYAEAALMYPNTLKYLFLDDRVDCIQPHLMQIELYNSLAPRLQEFKHLEELEVKVYTDKSLFELESSVDRCPSSLHTLRFSAFRPNPEIASRLGVSDTDEIRNLLLVQPQHNDKPFEGDRIMFSELSVNYLMHKFPNLDSLTINRVGFAGDLDGNDNDMSEEEIHESIVEDDKAEGTLD